MKSKELGIVFQTLNVLSYFLFHKITNTGLNKKLMTLYILALSSKEIYFPCDSSQLLCTESDIICEFVLRLDK